MQNKDKGDGIEDSPLDMLLVILLVGASKEVVTPSSLIDLKCITQTNTLIHLNSSSPSPSNQPLRRERGRLMEIPLFFNHLLYTMV